MADIHPKQLAKFRQYQEIGLERLKKEFPDTDWESRRRTDEQLIRLLDHTPTAELARKLGHKYV